MAVYRWTGTTRAGKKVKGEMDAPNEQVVAQTLRRQRIQPVKVKAAPKDIFENISLLKPRVKEKDIVLFTRQFATMIDAGLPIIQCLDILYTQQANATFRRILKEIKESVEGGATLFNASGKNFQNISMISLLI